MLKQASLDVETEGSLYYKIGKIRFEKNDYSVALEKLKKAADLLPSSINKLDEIIAPRPHCLCDDQSPFITMYTNMGIMHEKDCQFKEAINCYKEAVKIKNESKVGVATAHNYLGLLYYRLGKYEEAREHHMKAMELVDEGDSNWIEFQRNLNKANERCQHLTTMF
jgi:tetratricopeptide (TPR) repeat protein